MADNRHPLNESAKAAAKVANAVKNSVNTAAKFIKSTIKLVKKIVNIIKGAAAGSIYGAIAAFVWECRDLIIKIVIAISVILLIPVLVICMLPSVVFNDLSQAYVAENKDSILLNDVTIISKNIDTISEFVDRIKADSEANILFDIEKDFENSDEQHKIIVDLSEGQEEATVAMLISQYSASKIDNIFEISISDMEKTLWKNSDKLYSYSKKVEDRTVIVKVETVDEESGDIITYETEVVEKCAIYTVVSNDKDYIADNIFFLSEGEKKLASYYEENLKLFLEKSLS